MINIYFIKNINILNKRFMKKFTKFEIATIKRTAENVNPMVTKKAKIAEQMIALKQEWDTLSTMQSQYEESIKTMTGGYTTEDLVEKVTKVTNSVDKNGKPIKVTKFVLKYPDTVIPPVETNREEEFNTAPGDSSEDDEVEFQTPDEYDYDMSRREEE